jgi:DNA-binding transcriptional MocR family regulator
MNGDRHVTGRTLARHLGQWRGDHSGVAYLELAERITLLVRDGRLPARTRLPAERELATALTLSRTTVAAAYDQLRQNGVVHSRRGSGSWTMAADAPGTEPSPFAPSGDGSTLDLAYAAPGAPASLPEALTWAAEQIGRLAGGSGYQLLGLDDLRAVVAARFTRRGLPTTPDQILITSGAQHAISLTLSALISPGDRILVEHPTYPNALDAIAREHARAVPVGFAGAAWDTDTMAAAVRDACPGLIYLIPDYQNPTGHCMSLEQRAEIVALSRRTRTPVLIDETMTELPLDGEPPAPLAASGPDSGAAPLITIGSASKTLWGGLRIGWVRARRAVIGQLARARASVDISTSVLDQLTTQHLLERLDDRARPSARAARRAPPRVAGRTAGRRAVAVGGPGRPGVQRAGRRRRRARCHAGRRAAVRAGRGLRAVPAGAVHAARGAAGAGRSAAAGGLADPAGQHRYPRPSPRRLAHPARRGRVGRVPRGAPRRDSGTSSSWRFLFAAHRQPARTSSAGHTLV